MLVFNQKPSMFTEFKRPQLVWAFLIWTQRNNELVYFLTFDEGDEKVALLQFDPAKALFFGLFNSPKLML